MPPRIFHEMPTSGTNVEYNSHAIFFKANDNNLYKKNLSLSESSALRSCQ